MHQKFEFAPTCPKQNKVSLINFQLGTCYSMNGKISVLTIEFQQVVAHSNTDVRPADFYFNGITTTYTGQKNECVTKRE
jgi:hypothetical protein